MVVVVNKLAAWAHEAPPAPVPCRTLPGIGKTGLCSRRWDERSVLGGQLAAQLSLPSGAVPAMAALLGVSCAAQWLFFPRSVELSRLLHRPRAGSGPIQASHFRCALGAVAAASLRVLVVCLWEVLFPRISWFRWLSLLFSLLPDALDPTPQGVAVADETSPRALKAAAHTSDSVVGGRGRTSQGTIAHRGSVCEVEPRVWCCEAAD